jgi:hypothetical protein
MEIVISLTSCEYAYGIIRYIKAGKNKEYLGKDDFSFCRLILGVFEGFIKGVVYGFCCHYLRKVGIINYKISLPLSMSLALLKIIENVDIFLD